MLRSSTIPSIVSVFYAPRSSMVSVALSLSVLTLAGVVLTTPLHANITLAKREYTNARFTWYDAGLGACGTYNTNVDMVSIGNVSCD